MRDIPAVGGVFVIIIVFPRSIPNCRQVPPLFRGEIGGAETGGRAGTTRDPMKSQPGSLTGVSANYPGYAEFGEYEYNLV